MEATAERQVRISRVAGRYLVFDIDDVVYIRRHHGICAVLTGTMPQNPTQNLFLGLPVELHAEEAQLLVDKGVAYIADELTDHLSQLTRDESARKAYLQHLKQQRRNAQQVFDEEKARMQARHQGKRKAKQPEASDPEAPAAVSAAENEDPSSSALFSPATPASGTKQEKKDALLPGVTPTTSLPLLPAISPGRGAPVDPSTTTKLPFYRYLNSRGYYTTPGLRFGGDFSVYPGDPFRYHAHYLANSYGWDEPVAMLDLVTSGRLGTAVKKSFLFGAEKPPAVASEGGGVEGRGGDGGGEREVRVFCVEWAGM
ncbi:hypothetical protein VTH06DRAFT_6019 [Thermothelomyces fergusii]